jgi:hypothetical protein
MRFQVPQFIEVEDKIFGPLTFKQFAYLIGGAGICFVIYHFIGSLFISIIFMLPFAVLALALAFYKYNGKPFAFLVESAAKYFFGGKLYIWKKEERAPVSKGRKLEQVDTPIDLFIPKLSDSKLKELTWSLDIKNAENPATGSGGRKNV